MTPKEKAIELADKYFPIVGDIDRMKCNSPRIYMGFVVQCALIAVDLHLEELSKMKLIFSDREIHCKYWQEVKNEINQLITKNK
ncbi:MAG: hypothetical protein RIR01_1950 [Bacteroidota bacterium]|jgi:hypothetical protein